MELHCRNAAIVFDKFHGYSYVNDTMDELRRLERNKANAAGKELLKGSRGLWLKASPNLRQKENQTLEQIMALNAKILIC